MTRPPVLENMMQSLMIMTMTTVILMMVNILKMIKKTVHDGVTDYDNDDDDGDDDGANNVGTGVDDNDDVDDDDDDDAADDDASHKNAVVPVTSYKPVFAKIVLAPQFRAFSKSKCNGAPHAPVPFWNCVVAAKTHLRDVLTAHVVVIPSSAMHSAG